MDIEKINLAIKSINFSEIKNGEIITILWNSNIGFGNYTIVREGTSFTGDSECMDSNNNKTFIIKLLNSLQEKINNIDVSKLKIL